MLSPEQVTPAFVDAHRVWSTLEAVLGAPNLYTAATEKFPSLTMPHGPDKEAFELLVADDFLEVPIELRNDIDRFRQLDQSAERVREELAAVYRRLKPLNLQHRNATRDADQATGFLRSKSKQWQAKQRVGALQQESEACSTGSTVTRGSGTDTGSARRRSSSPTMAISCRRTSRR